MSYCSRCGAPNKPTSNFCASCGAPLVPPPGGGGSGSRKDGPRPPRRSRTPLWIALAVLTVLLAVLAIVFLPRNSRQKDGEEPATPVHRSSSGPDLREVYAAAAPYENRDGTVSEEQAQVAIDAVYSAALENPYVLSCEKDEYGVTMEVADGPDFVYCPVIEDLDAGGGELEIITLQPYDTENREKARKNNWSQDLDAPDDVARALAEKEARWEFEDDVNDGDVTMDRILSLDDYQVILWHGHGGYTQAAGYFLCTEVRWSDELGQRYGLDKSNCCRYGSGTKVGLRPAFFEQHFPDGAFDNAFIYLATCHSGKEQTMAQTLLDKGAAVVFVNSETIGRGYNLNMMHLIAESYLVGPGGDTAQAAIRYLGSGYSFNTPENWSIGDSLALAQLRYGRTDPRAFSTTEVYYLCRPGMDRCPYAEWVKGFPSASPVPVHRQGISDVTVTAGTSQYADLDFDGLQDLISVSDGGRLQLQVDFGSGESWQADMLVDSAGQKPYARLLSFNDGDYLCYAFISENFGSKYGGLYCALYGQDYLRRGPVVPLNCSFELDLDSYGGVYDGQWVVVVGTASQDAVVYGIPEPLYGDLQRMAADYGEPLLPIPYADGVCYEIYAEPRADGNGYSLVYSISCSSQLGFLECPGTVYGACRMRDASHAAVERVWFAEDPNYLYPLSGVTPAMVSRDLSLAVPASGVADGQYWAILYAEDDANGSRVSTEVDLEDYMCFSYEEIASLRPGDTLEMSRFVPIWMSINYRAYGGFSDGYEDVTVESIDRDSDGWMGDTLYINRGSWNQVVLQNWNGCWRVVAEEDYIPMQILQTVSLSFAPDIRIYDRLTPVIIPPPDGSTVYEWSDPYDFFVFNYDMRYFEAQITVKNGVITEMTIPYRP